MADTAAPLIHPSRILNRWVQLIAGIIAMMAIANLQYAWTLFTKPMQSHLHVSLTAIQGIFSLFIIVETWLVPFEGYLVDRIGPRLMLGVGAILVGAGLDLLRSGRDSAQPVLLVLPGRRWRRNRLRRNHWQRAEMVSGSPRALRRSHRRRLRHRNRADCFSDCQDDQGFGYQHTLVVWGIIQGVVVLFAALFMARPPVGWTPPDWAEKEVKIKQRVRSSAVDMTPWQMLRQPSFYVIYLMMTMLSFRRLGGYCSTQPHGRLLPRR